MRKKYHTVRTNSNSKIVGRGKLDTPNAQIHDRSLIWLETDTPNAQIHDRSLIWLETDTPNAQIHDRSLIWLETDTLMNNGWIKLLLWTKIHRNVQTIICLEKYMNEPTQKT